VYNIGYRQSLIIKLERFNAFPPAAVKKDVETHYSMASISRTFINFNGQISHLTSVMTVNMI